jgi:hypothetical protein
MNSSALRQVSDHWKAVMGGISVLRDAYLVYVAPPAQPLTLSSFWKVCRLGLMLPAYLLRRASRPYADGTLPALTAVIYKIMIGMNQVAEQQMMMAYGSGRDEQPIVDDGRALYAFAEAGQLFIGRRTVCAGTPAMMDEIFDVTLSGRSVEIDREPMRALLDDAVIEYFNLVMRLDTEKALYNVLTAIAVHDLARALRSARDDGPPAALTTRVEALVERMAAASPRSFEIAKTPDAIRDRILRGARGLCDELEQELVRINGRGIAVAPPEIEPATRPRASDGLAAVLGKERGWDGASCAAVADAVLEHFAHERHYVRTFQVLQDRIDHVLGWQPGPRLDAQAVSDAYGPSLRDLIADPLHGTIAASDDRTLLTVYGYELEV